MVAQSIGYGAEVACRLGLDENCPEIDIGRAMSERENHGTDIEPKLFQSWHE
jgi:hypothetical protein